MPISSQVVPPSLPAPAATYSSPMPVQTLSGTLLWTSLREGSQTIRTRAVVGFTPEQSLLRLQEAIQNMWASSTFQDRKCLIERWLRWCKRYNQEPNTASASLFLMAIPRITPQTQLAYAKAMSGTFRFLGWERQDLLTLASALRAQGAALPIDQAKPMRKVDLEQWIQTLSHPWLRLTAMVCWKTASRWGDVVNLEKAHYIQAQDDEVIVSWSTLPKGRRADPYTPSMYTVIHGHWTTEIAQLIRASPENIPLCPWTTDKLDSEFKKCELMKEYTAHSFKRGAASHVIQELQRLSIEMRPAEFSVLLKHKLTYDLLASSDLRYPEAGPGLARMLGTQNLTKLL